MSKTQYVSELQEQLRDYAKGKVYINISQIANAMGVARETAAQLVFHLRYLPNGREKLFFINDVALKIYEGLQCDGIGGLLIDHKGI